MLHHQNTCILYLCNFNGHPKDYMDIKSTHKQQFMKLLQYMYNLGMDISIRKSNEHYAYLLFLSSLVQPNSFFF